MTLENDLLVPGVRRYSRTQVKMAKKASTGKKVEKSTEKASAGSKKLKHPGTGVACPKVTRKSTKKIQKLRSTITPGTILIILSGAFRGKRVVFLKRLESGLLIVTGPHKINGVPIRRVNQTNVIATSVKVDISNVKIDENINDKYFGKSGEKYYERLARIRNPAPKDPKLSKAGSERAKTQAAIDKEIITAVKKVPLLKNYLGSRFALTNNQFPHLMKF